MHWCDNRKVAVSQPAPLQSTGRSPAAQPRVLLFQLADPGLGTTLLRHSGLAFVLHPLFGPQTCLSLGVPLRFSSGPGLCLLNASLAFLKTAFALSISPGPFALERGDVPPRRRVVPCQPALLSAPVQVQYRAASLQHAVLKFLSRYSRHAGGWTGRIICQPAHGG